VRPTALSVRVLRQNYLSIYPGIGLSLTSFQSREEELQAMYEGHPLNHSLQREIEQGNLGFLLRRPK